MTLPYGVERDVVSTALLIVDSTEALRQEVVFQVEDATGLLPAIDDMQEWSHRYRIAADLP